MNKSGIHIKKANRGKFTSWAKSHGMGVQQAASHVMANKGKYSSTVVKRANFAKNAAKWHHENGGVVKGYADGGTVKEYANGGRVEKADLPDNDPNKANADIAYVVRTRSGDYPVYHKDSESAKTWRAEYANAASKSKPSFKSSETGLEYLVTDTQVRQPQVNNNTTSTAPATASSATANSSTNQVTQPVQTIPQQRQTSHNAALKRYQEQEAMLAIKRGPKQYNTVQEIPTQQSKWGHAIENFYNIGAPVSEAAFGIKPNYETATAALALETGQFIVNTAKNPSKWKENLAESTTDLSEAALGALFLKGPKTAKSLAKATAEWKYGIKAAEMLPGGIKGEIPNAAKAAKEFARKVGPSTKWYSGKTEELIDAAKAAKEASPFRHGGGVHNLRGNLRRMKLRTNFNK